MEGCQKGQQAQRSWPHIVAMYTYNLILKKEKKEKGTCAVHLCKNLTILNNMYMWGENYENILEYIVCVTLTNLKIFS